MGLMGRVAQGVKSVVAQEAVHGRQRDLDRAIKRARRLRSFAGMAVALAAFGFAGLVLLGGADDEGFQLDTDGIAYRCTADGGVEGASATSESSRLPLEADGVTDEPCQEEADERRWEHRRRQVLLAGLTLISGIAARASYRHLPERQRAVEHCRQLLEEAQSARSAVTPQGDGSRSRSERQV